MSKQNLIIDWQGFGCSFRHVLLQEVDIETQLEAQGFGQNSP